MSEIRTADPEQHSRTTASPTDLIAAAIPLLIMALSMPNMWRGLVQDAIDILNGGMDA
jgi:hypothetical protein